MLSFSAHQRYFLFSNATDMRKGFSGLSGLVRKHIPHDLMSGDVFIFINKRRDKIKLLMWDSNGFAIWYKELEKGTFGSLEMGKNTSVELVWSDLVMLLEGIEISSIKRRKRVSVCLSTYFLIKKVFLALGQKDETSLHRKGETEIHRGL